MKFPKKIVLEHPSVLFRFYQSKPKFNLVDHREFCAGLMPGGYQKLVLGR